MKAKPKPDADCHCGGPVFIRRRGFGASYFYCMNPDCPHHLMVFRCYGSIIDDDLYDELYNDLKLERAKQCQIHTKNCS